MTSPQPADQVAGSSPPSRRAPPWQVKVAILLIVLWWCGSYSYLLPTAGGIGREDLGPFLGVGFWSVLVGWALVNTWRGGRATRGVAKAAYLFGGIYEFFGVVLTLMWFVNPDLFPLWASVALMAVAACPLYAGRLLNSQAAKAYAAAWSRNDRAPRTGLLARK